MAVWAGFDAATSENFIVMVNDLVDDDVHVYHVTNDGAAAAITSPDLDYIGVVADMGSTALHSGQIM
jgi:hypothetical protein